MEGEHSPSVKGNKGNLVFGPSLVISPAIAEGHSPWKVRTIPCTPALHSCWD